MKKRELCVVSSKVLADVAEFMVQALTSSAAMGVDIRPREPCPTLINIFGRYLALE